LRPSIFAVHIYSQQYFEVLAVIMVTENVAQEHTTTEEDEAIVRNWQSDGTGSDGSYHSPEDELGHLLQKRGAQKGSDDCDPDYIPKQQEVW
jgi:hypothetical protein